MNGTIFGIGPLEILVVAILILLVFGPERVPSLMRDLGRSMRSLRKYYVAFSTELKREMEPFQEDIKGLQEAAKGMQDDLNAIRQAADIRGILGDQPVDPAKPAATDSIPGQTIAPPTAPAPTTPATTTPASTPQQAPVTQPSTMPQAAAAATATTQTTYAPVVHHNGARVELSDDNPWAQSAYTPRNDKLEDDNPWAS